MKKKEIVLYTIFGVFTSIVNYLLFYVLCKINIDYKIANIITLVVVKALAYICNKLFVFKSKCSSTGELIKEIFKYIVSRLATLLIDFWLLILLVDVFNVPKFYGKIITILVVVIINYIMCITYVFKKKTNNDENK